MWKSAGINYAPPANASAQDKALYEQREKERLAQDAKSLLTGMIPGVMAIGAGAVVNRSSAVKSPTQGEAEAANQAAKPGDVKAKSGAYTAGSNAAGRLSYEPVSESWTSPGGLVYGQGSAQGNRVLHVLEHTVPDPSKPVHSVFNVDRTQVVGLVDEAWAARVGAGTLQANGNRVWVVDMGRQVGTGGQTSIQIVVRDGTTQVITAFPK